MTISIRKVDADDLNKIVHLIRDFAVYENLSDYCEVDEARLFRAMFSKNAIAEGLIALDGETAAGYAMFYPAFSSFRGELGLHIEDLFVLEAFRGKCIGLSFIKEIARIARERGFVRLDLMVQQQNLSAVRFYEKLGAEANADERHLKFTGDAFIKLSS